MVLLHTDAGELHGGKKPASPRRFTAYEEIRPALVRAGLIPTLPKVWGHGNDFAYGQWMMLGNGPDDTVFPGFQGAGDCTIADAIHDETEAAKNAGRTLPTFTGKTAIDTYVTLTGKYNGAAYDPQTGANDNGLDMQDVVEYRQQVGLVDDTGAILKIGQAISVTPGNVQHVLELAYLLENVDLGVQLAQAQEDQYNAALAKGISPVWDYVTGSPTLGGHAIPLVGPAIISWGFRVGVTLPFLSEQMDEAHAYVDDPERYNEVTGETVEGFTDQDLEKYLVMKAQAKAAL